MAFGSPAPVRFRKGHITFGEFSLFASLGSMFFANLFATTFGLGFDVLRQ